ncbi:TetR/AcrR family transcriptional regulator [Roseomonas xinghualingensis]|uniref:TetR/AcrR family transcriptional regulator n=1 Tax=Roseomonas xinghualingensis TaxID=2986475 RepID=UPI0021F1371F|nr:TetR/AcrR family transcriptional regulator [Roseomonas sp. SXEYE001]MCV4206643.1 TetR/AcrR family transcriptional regulator [Roseomonas sp. SXEYE001]
MSKPPEPHGAASSRQAQRSADMRRRLCQAAIDVLCDVGYERLSTPLIAARAGVSRGAQTHHFPAKADLMVGAFRHLLQSWEEARVATFGTTDPPRVTLETYLRFAWREIFGKPSYVAALELMMAARADERLGGQLREALDEWAVRRGAVWREVLRFSGLRDDDAFQHINMSLLRGMAVHRGFNHAESENEAVLDEWIALVRHMGVVPPAP